MPKNREPQIENPACSIGIHLSENPSVDVKPRNRRLAIRCRPIRGVVDITIPEKLAFFKRVTQTELFMPNTKILTYCGVVYPWQCDHMGHMNVMWYTGKFDEASWSFAAKLGIDTSYMREHHFGLAGVQQNIAYKKELIAGDVVNVYTGILELRPK